MSTLEEVVAEMAATLEPAAFEVAVYLSCREADSIVRVFAAGGQREAALSWVKAHAENEDEEIGDRHFMVDPEEYLVDLLEEED
jgi:phytoene/squalene synthetase